jgi:predicted secreted protein
MRLWIVGLTLVAALTACGSDDDGGGGGAWRVAEQPDAITLVSSEYEAPDTSLVGAGGVEVFVFEGVAEGSGELLLEYVRSFDDPPEPAETADFQVQVDGS